MEMKQVWLVTGANRGLGLAIAGAAQSAGHTVAASARDISTLQRIQRDGDPLCLAVELDVTSINSIRTAVRSVVETFGRIDVLVNNAGYGQLGAFEEISSEQIRSQFETNVFGLMEVTRAVLPTMRQQRSGKIFNVASAAGYKGGDRYGVYAASKFAVVGFSEALAAELAEFGIGVSVVAPGFFRTDFLDSTSVAHPQTTVDDYLKGSVAKRSLLESLNHQQGGDPRLLGASLVALANEDTAPVHFPVGEDAVAWVAERDAAVQRDIERFRALSVNTKFVGV